MSNSKSIRALGLSILIVDGYELIRKQVAKVALKVGFSRVLETADMNFAVEVVQDHETIDMIVCNISIFKRNGYEILDILRKNIKKPRLPILITSGANERDDIIKAVGYGIYDYIVIPFQSKDLEDKLSSAIDKYINPSPQQIILNQCEELIELKEYARARKFLEELMIENNTASIRHTLAICLMHENKLVHAKNILEESVRLFPDFLKHYHTITTLYLKIGDTKKAIGHLTKELELHPKQPARQVLLANLLLKAKHPNQALHHYRQALREDVKYKDALYGMALSLIAMGNIHKAIYYLKRYRRNHPDDSRPISTLLNSTLGTEFQRFGESALKEELKANPNRPDAAYYLAKLYTRTQRPELARKVLEESCSIHKTYKKTHTLLAQLYLREKNAHEALSVLHRYMEHSKDLESPILVAKVYLGLGKYSSATETLNSGFKMGSPPKKLFKLLFECAMKSRQFTKAYFLREAMKDDSISTSFGDSHKDLDAWQNARDSRRQVTEKAS